VRVIKRKTIVEQFVRHPDVEGPLRAWLADVESADWESPDDLKQRYRSASILPGNRVVFNIKGNQYRLIVYSFYRARLVYIKFFGTHAEYDKVDATTVDDLGEQ
jgi:mRNA interferase HigB